jgi:hypothetical protein
MRVYGHLQVEHSLAMSKRVSFNQASDAVPTSKASQAEAKAIK